MGRFGRANWRTKPRGSKEKLAAVCGFTVNFDGIILSPNGGRVELRKTEYGYLVFSAGGKTVYAHRFIWHCLVGPVASGKVIDHINRNRQDCRIENLREVTVSENNKNRCAKGAAWVAKINALS